MKIQAASDDAIETAYVLIKADMRIKRSFRKINRLILFRRIVRLCRWPLIWVVVDELQRWLLEFLHAVLTLYLSPSRLSAI
jgi:hypothetical protein